MAFVGVELETLVFEPDALTTRPPPCVPYRSLAAASEIYQCSEVYQKEFISVVKCIRRNY